MILIAGAAVVGCTSYGPAELTENIDYQYAFDQVDPLDKGGRWLATGVMEVNLIDGLTESEKLVINSHFLDLILNYELRFDEDLHDEFVALLASEGFPEEAITAVERAHIRVASPLHYHDGYWVGKMRPPGSPLRLTVINDMHVDAATNRVTVYAQSRMLGKVVAPAQVGPGEFAELPNGDRVGFHPDSVYLNCSGQELSEDDGTGSWWVKHSWVLGGEGYYNTELRPQEYYDEGFYATGILLEDGLTMKVGAVVDGAEVYNTRTPVLTGARVSYRVTRFGPANLDPEAGPIDLTPTEHFEIDWRWKTTPSPFDGLGRRVPATRNEN